ncbi:hypothetical protein RIF29_42193 [Crotalaria pallida]|uniref:Cupin type-1 domain-containing protein n=1 Tax=Crotalaria pallida TaxID=3830 RepID=A0AAN9ECH0_CROPI
MAFDLTPKTAETLFEGEGGGYYTWTSSQVPVLAKTNVGAGRLVLHPQGFALPHYSDSSKVGYVIQGTGGVAGLILPTTGKEVVVKLEQGDVIPVPIGGVSWWFNNGDSDLVIIFLGETSKALIPGQFSYFFITGAIGVVGSFSNELTSKVYNLTNDEVTKLTKSQSGLLIIKLEKDKPIIPKPKASGLVFNIDAAHPDNVVKNGGLVTTLSEKGFPFIGEVGLSLIRVKLEPGAIKAPSYPTSPVVRLIYIIRGSGKIEIVGLNGKLALDTQVEAAQLIVVPQFFVVAQIAGEEGLESYTIVTTTKPLFEEFAGKASIWSAISPTVLQAALNVDSEFQKLFVSKNKDTTNIIPSTI